MPGEDTEAAIEAVRALHAKGIPSALTVLGENVHSPSDARAAGDRYVELLGRLQADGLPAEISVKLTHLGLDLDQREAEANLTRVVEVAQDSGSFVWVDMESSGYVDVTLEVYGRVRARLLGVGLCLQAYLYRTAEDLLWALDAGARVRLVKGAYMESREVAFPRKTDVDRNYFTLALELLRRSETHPEQRPAVATHDLRLIERIRVAAGERSLPRDAFEVQMLYGIRASQQVRLAREGVPIRILVSYGEAWFTWYMRRLAERPANVGFVLKSAVPALRR
jgi:proline dehydrogenase